MMRCKHLLMAMILCAAVCHSAPVSLAQQRLPPGLLEETFHEEWWLAFDRVTIAMAPTADGGAILLGTADPVGFVTSTPSGIGIANLITRSVVKLGPSGAIQWQRGLTVEGHHTLLGDLVVTPDGIAVVGSVVPAFEDGRDAVFVKLTPQGEFEFLRVYHGAFDDAFFAIAARPEGGFLVAGLTESYGNGGGDYWVAALDNLGNIQWASAYGTPSYEDAREIALSTNGEFVVSSSRGLLRLDAQGRVLWQQDVEGPFLTAMDTVSGGDVLTATAAIHLRRYSPSGALVWEKQYGLGGSRAANTIRATYDGGAIVGGDRLFGGGIWLGRIDDQGEFLWLEDFENETEWNEDLRDIAVSRRYRTVIPPGNRLRVAPAAPTARMILGDHILATQPFHILALTTRGISHESHPTRLLRMDSDGRLPGLDCPRTDAITADPEPPTMVVVNPAFVRIATPVVPVSEPGMLVSEPDYGSVSLCHQRPSFLREPGIPLDMCFKVPDVPSRLAPGDRPRPQCNDDPDCPWCVRSFSRDDPPLDNPDFRARIFQSLPALLADGSSPDDLRAAMAVVREAFQQADTGPRFDEALKSRVLDQLRSSSSDYAPTLAIFEALNALELDLRVPESKARGLQGKDGTSVDFGGVATIYVPGRIPPDQVQLRVRVDEQAFDKRSHRPLWPRAAYEVVLSDALPEGGYFELEVYVGGFQATGSIDGLRLYRRDGGEYEDVTTGFDLARRTVRGRSMQPGIFVVGRPFFSSPMTAPLDRPGF